MPKKYQPLAWRGGGVMATGVSAVPLLMLSSLMSDGSKQKGDLVYNKMAPRTFSVRRCCRHDNMPLDDLSADLGKRQLCYRRRPNHPRRKQLPHQQRASRKWYRPAEQHERRWQNITPSWLVCFCIWSASRRLRMRRKRRRTWRRIDPSVRAPHHCISPACCSCIAQFRNRVYAAESVLAGPQDRRTCIQYIDRVVYDRAWNCRQTLAAHPHPSVIIRILWHCGWKYVDLQGQWNRAEETFPRRARKWKKRSSNWRICRIGIDKNILIQTQYSGTCCLAPMAIVWQFALAAATRQPQQQQDKHLSQWQTAVTRPLTIKLCPAKDNRMTILKQRYDNPLL